MSNTTSNKTAILGVPVVSNKVVKKANGLFEMQEVTTETRKVTHGALAGCFIRTHVSFDDDCGNGHHTFSITADIARDSSFTDRSIVSCGCLHKEVAEFFPELAHLIKWHLCSTDGPMHYISNTVYSASDRDYKGKRKGEPTSFEERVKFSNFPVTFALKSALMNFLKAKVDGEVHSSELVVKAVTHKDSGVTGAYQYSDKYTFTGCDNVGWADAPFGTKREAEEFAEAIIGGYTIELLPVKFSEGKERDLNRARRVALWPDATDEELMVASSELKKTLERRLPALVDDMRKDIENAGLTW